MQISICTSKQMFESVSVATSAIAIVTLQACLVVLLVVKLWVKVLGRGKYISNLHFREKGRVKG